MSEREHVLTVYNDRTPTRAELLALVDRWREKSDRWTRVNRGPDTRVAGGVWGDAARELAALLGGCDG